MKNTILAVVFVLLISGVLFFTKKSEQDTQFQPTVSEVDEKSSEIPPTSGVDEKKPEAPPAREADVKKPDKESQPPASSQEKEFTVTGQNFSFTPNAIKVKKGDRVKITFQNNQGFHDFVIDEYGLAAKRTQAPGTEVLEFTADKAGSFEYYCSVGTHRLQGMVGTLTVE